MAQDSSNVVIDHGKSQWSDLWKKEDYLAIWLGFIIIAVCILAYTTFGPKAEFAEKMAAANQIQEAELAKAPFKTIAWYKAQDDKGKLKGRVTMLGLAAGGTDAEVKQLLSTGQYLFPVVSDPDYAAHKVLGEPLTPYTLVFKPDGSIVYAHLGVIEDIDGLYQQIKTLLD